MSRTQRGRPQASKSQRKSRGDAGQRFTEGDTHTRRRSPSSAAGKAPTQTPRGPLHTRVDVVRKRKPDGPERPRERSPRGARSPTAALGAAGRFLVTLNTHGAPPSPAMGFSRPHENSCPSVGSSLPHHRHGTADGPATRREVTDVRRAGHAAVTWQDRGRGSGLCGAQLGPHGRDPTEGNAPGPRGRRPPRWGMGVTPAQVRMPPPAPRRGDGASSVIGPSSARLDVSSVASACRKNKLASRTAGRALTAPCPKPGLWSQLLG